MPEPAVESICRQSWKSCLLSDYSLGEPSSVTVVGKRNYSANSMRTAVVSAKNAWVLTRSASRWNNIGHQ